MNMWIRVAVYVYVAIAVCCIDRVATYIDVAEELYIYLRIDVYYMWS